MLSNLADGLADYAIYQIESGAQIIQVFDSWAGNLSPCDYDAFALPYQRMVVEKIKKAHPEVPIIMYINKSGALLERMASSGVDIISLDWTVSISEARKRIGHDIGIQGNLDPFVLHGPKDAIKEQTEVASSSIFYKRTLMHIPAHYDSLSLVFFSPYGHRQFSSKAAAATT